jgi:hypothetical protein
MKLKITLLILVLVVSLGTFITCRYLEPPERPYTLREALWVSDRDMKHFYPPHSPQSKAIISVIESAFFDVDKKEYNGYLLYRMGFTTSDDPSEPLLIQNFQPPKP